MTDATCTCGYVFRYDAEFFAGRDLPPPKRCRRCREERRARRVPCRGVVFRTGPRFGILRAEDGREFIAFSLPEWADPGDRAEWSVDPEATTPLGKLPVAYEARLAER